MNQSNHYWSISASRGPTTLPFSNGDHSPHKRTQMRKSRGLGGLGAVWEDLGGHLFQKPTQMQDAQTAFMAHPLGMVPHGASWGCQILFFSQTLPLLLLLVLLLLPSCCSFCSSKLVPAAGPPAPSAAHHAHPAAPDANDSPYTQQLDSQVSEKAAPNANDGPYPRQLEPQGS